MINTGWISVKNEMPPEHESADVDWNDDLDINYIGCPRTACEAYFRKDKNEY